MRIGIVSDTHGDSFAIRRVIEQAGRVTHGYTWATIPATRRLSERTERLSILWRATAISAVKKSFA